MVSFSDLFTYTLVLIAIITLVMIRILEKKCLPNSTKRTKRVKNRGFVHNRGWTRYFTRKNLTYDK